MENVFNKKMPLVMGADHAGFRYKAQLKKMLELEGWEVEDKGAFGEDSVDYPDFVHPVAEQVAGGKAAAGVVICGSGNGVCMTVNKHKGIRGALCWNEELAVLARQHNNANVLCIPARFVEAEMAERMVKLFLETAFEGGRHQKRVGKIEA